MRGKLWEAKANERTLAPLFNEHGAHSKHTIFFVQLLAALFSSQHELKATENQMFKLAGRGVNNSFYSKKYYSLRKVLLKGAVCWRPADKLGAVSEDCYTLGWFTLNDRGLFPLL